MQFRLVKDRGNVRMYLDDVFMKHLRGETKNG